MNSLEAHLLTRGCDISALLLLLLLLLNAAVAPNAAVRRPFVSIPASDVIAATDKELKWNKIQGKRRP